MPTNFYLHFKATIGPEHHPVTATPKHRPHLQIGICTKMLSGLHRAPTTRETQKSCLAEVCEEWRPNAQSY